MTLRRPNKDRVTPPVLAGGAAGVVIAGVARALIDRYVNPVDRDVYWNLFSTVIVPAIPVVLAWLGAQKAKRDVTPILPGDQPRNLEGEDLKPASHRGPGSGYQPTRAARPEERSHRYDGP